MLAFRKHCCRRRLVAALLVAVLCECCRTADGGWNSRQFHQRRSSRHINLPRSLLQQPDKLADPLASLDDELYSSQLGQDRFVLQHHPEPGTYLEIGAHKGRALSNTFILDYLGWEGGSKAVSARTRTIRCSSSRTLGLSRQCTVDFCFARRIKRISLLRTDF